jgi:hypothetical protein
VTFVGIDRSTNFSHVGVSDRLRQAIPSFTNSRSQPDKPSA